MFTRTHMRRLKSQIFYGLCFIATASALFVLSLILWSLFSKGLAGFNLEIFTLDTPAPDSVGGLRNAIIGSLFMCFIGMTIALFVGILAGTWLCEYGGKSKYAEVVRFLNDVLLSAPSILIGLCVYEAMVLPFGGFSAWAGAVALSIVAVPIVTRTTEDILNLQPNALREAGMALGATRFSTIRKIIWKSAAAGLLTGGLLAFARISGETAPLLFTALGNDYFNLDMGSPMAALSLAINKFGMSPFDSWVQLAWTASLLVALSVLTVNILGRLISRDAVSK